MSRPVTLAERLATHAATKVRVTAGMALVFFAPYLTIQTLQGVPDRVVPTTWLDDRIPFDPAWVAAYVSIYVLVPLVPWLFARRGDVLRYFAGFSALCACSFVLFVAYPARSPRPALPTGNAVYEWLVRLDGAGNAFPSLHAGLAVFALATTPRALDADAGPRARTAVTLAATAWAAAILYATIATRQHVVWDLVAGTALALLASRGAFRLGLTSRPG